MRAFSRKRNRGIDTWQSFNCFSPSLIGPVHVHARHARNSSVTSTSSIPAADPVVRTHCIVSPPEWISQVRHGLTAEENQAVTDEDVCRFIRASAKDLTHAVKRLKHTLSWRREEMPHLVVCPACVRTANSHYMHTIGFDRCGRHIASTYTEFPVPVQR